MDDYLEECLEARQLEESFDEWLDDAWDDGEEL